MKDLKVPIEKLNYIFELHKVVVDESRVSCFTNAARVFYNQRIVCMVNCVENHFNGNKRSFLDVHSEALMKKHTTVVVSFINLFAKEKVLVVVHNTINFCLTN